MFKVVLIGQYSVIHCRTIDFKLFIYRKLYFRTINSVTHTFIYPNIVTVATVNNYDIWEIGH